MSYYVITSKRFDKSLVKCIKRGLDRSKLVEAVRILGETGTLPRKYRPHKLSGQYKGCWECHIEPDWLLIWEINDDELVLILLDTGTHSDLFK